MRPHSAAETQETTESLFMCVHFDTEVMTCAV